MKTLICACALLLVLSADTRARAGERAFVVIVNAKNEQPLNAADLKAAYLRQTQTWKSGEKVRPVDVEGDGDARKAFLAKVLALTSDDFDRYWLEARYARAEQPPKRVDDDDAAIKFVGNFAGGIGFIDEESLSEAAKAKVRVALRVVH